MARSFLPHLDSREGDVGNDRSSLRFSDGSRASGEEPVRLRLGQRAVLSTVVSML